MKAEQTVYLARIVCALALGAAVLAALLMAGALPLERGNALLIGAVLLPPVLLIYPFVRHFHRRADEMLRQVHARACIFSVCASATVVGAVGILQALHLIGEVSWLFAFATLVATWALGLTLADRSQH